MAQTGVLLRIGCHDGQVVVTDERVYLRGPSQASEEVWSVPRARVAGVQTHAGLILAELAVYTRDGEAYNAAGVGASDALLAIDLLGYAPDRHSSGPNAPAERQELDLVCGGARLIVTDASVEWVGERPWRLLRKEIAGVSARMLSPAVDLAVHTHSGRICRATNVPVYGAIRVVELLGYVSGAYSGNGRRSRQEIADDHPTPKRVTPTQKSNAKDMRVVRRTVRDTSRASRSAASVVSSPPLNTRSNGAGASARNGAGRRNPRGLGRLAALLHLGRRR